METLNYNVGASHVAHWKRICLQCKSHGVNAWVREDPREKEMTTTPVFLLEKSTIIIGA